MEEAETTEEETEEEREIPKKTKKGKTVSMNTPKKVRSKLQPAPIEQVTEFDVAKYISNLPAGLSVGQAAHLIPKYRSGLAASVRRTRNKNKEADTNYVDANEHKTTAMKCEILVGREAVTAVVDSGAATSIITKSLMKKLNYSPNKPSKLVIVTANGARIKALGEVSNLPININYLKIPTNVQVLESKDDVLILGNDWLNKVKANINWHEQTLTIYFKGRRERLAITCINEELLPSRQEDYEEDEEEYETAQWDENYVYYSDILSSGEDDLEFNPWVTEDEEDLENDSEKDNPAIYLAENERSNKQNEEWNLNKDLHCGPLDERQQNLFQQLLNDNVDICAEGQMDIGKTNIIQHEIDTGNHVPIAKAAYRTTPAKKTFIENEIQDMLKKGIIRESKSPWAFPVVIVEKKDDTKRFCVDYRELNKVTRVDRYPLPRIDELLESFRTANWFTTLDLASGFWQVEMSPEDREKTAFITHRGLYEFNVMPFGLCNAPSTFQRLMNQVLRKFLGKFTAVYLDDIIIYSNTFEQHLDHLNQVFAAIRQACLKIKLRKCFFCFPNIAFLGHIVGRNGIAVDPKKVEKIEQFPIPTNLRELRSALGLFSYYRKFIKDFSKIAKPMLTLLKKDTPFEWTNKQQTAFNYLKKRLMTAPILEYPDFSKPFVLYTDASGTGLGAVLSQHDEGGKERVIAYASRSLNKAETNYPITDQECLAIVWAIKHFEQYLSEPFKVVTDHSALKFLQKCKVPTGRRARWIMYLQQFKFEIVHRPGKENKNADALSRQYEVESYFCGAENLRGETAYSDDTLSEPSVYDTASENDYENDADSEDNSEEEITTTSPTPWECCGQIICECTRNSPIDYNRYDDENDSDDEEVAQENEAEYSLKQRDDIISLYSYDDNDMTDNGWGDEYNEFRNTAWENGEYNDESWGLPEDNQEKEISNIWSVWTVSYFFTEQEVKDLYQDLIKTKWVTANQPIRRGKWACDQYCDEENHHLHSYCTICRKQIYPGMEYNHGCKFGFGIGEIHPDMNPLYLINDVFWSEPEFTLEEQEESDEDSELLVERNLQVLRDIREHRQRIEQRERCAKEIQTILEINERHRRELNGEPTGRIPLIENQMKPNIGRRFPRY